MDEALTAWLAEVQASGVKLGLDRIRSALTALGEPQRHQPNLLVAGTNGKGSTVRFASELLTAAGHRVGSTLSPHLVHYRERFRIDGAPSDDAALNRIGAVAAEALRGTPGFEELTFFELGTALAALAFADAGCGAAVWEVGMGGEFDASRACEPQVLALVTVDLDHQRWLGDDVAAIARTKARAAPAGGIVVSAEVRPDRLPAIEEAASEAGAELRLAGRDWRAWDDDGLCCEAPGLRLDHVPLGLGGAHQIHNAGCALAATLALCEQAGLTPPSPWEAGGALQRVKFAGRLERVRPGPGPRFLFDGAHNAAGAQALAAALAERKRPAKRTWLYAAMEDKDRRPLVEAIAPHVDAVVCTRGESSPRFADPGLLAEEVEAWSGKPATVLEPARAAARELQRRGSGRDEILVAGSLYLVGDARDALGLPVR